MALHYSCQSIKHRASIDTKMYACVFCPFVILSFHCRFAVCGETLSMLGLHRMGYCSTLAVAQFMEMASAMESWPFSYIQIDYAHAWCMCSIGWQAISSFWDSTLRRHDFMWILNGNWWCGELRHTCTLFNSGHLNILIMTLSKRNTDIVHIWI